MSALSSHRRSFVGSLDGSITTPTAESAPQRPPTTETPKEQPPTAPVSTLLSLTGAAEYDEMLAAAGETMCVMASMTAPAVALETERAPVEVCAVVDRSGSMSSEQKLSLVKKSLSLLVRELLPQDKLAIVAYDDTVTVPLALTAMTNANKKKAQAAVDALRTGGTTNLSGGLLKGMELMAPANGFTQSIVNALNARFVDPNAKPAAKAVWLFTDGHANVGLRTTPEILTQMDKILGDDAPMKVSAFGVGAQHNENMLRSIAESGGGQYYFIDSAAVIPTTFAECLGGLLTVVATDVSLTIAPAEGVTIQENLSAPKASGATFTLKDIYAEEEKDYVVRLALPACDNLPQAEKEEDVPQMTQVVATVTLTYTTKGASQTVSKEICVQRVEALADKPRVPDDKVDKHRNRLTAANAMAEAKLDAEKGNYDVANLKMARCKGALQKSATNQAEYTKDLCDEMDEMMDLCSATQWQECAKVMAQTEMGHRVQRCSASRAKANETMSKKSKKYTTSAQSMLASKWA